METLQEIAELLGKYGVDVMQIVAVMFLTFVLKSFDRKDKFKEGYVIFPLLSSIIVVGVVGWIRNHSVDVVMVLVYGGLSAWLYDMYAAARKARASKGK